MSVKGTAKAENDDVSNRISALSWRQAGPECCSKPNKWFVHCSSALAPRTSQSSEHWNAAAQKGKNEASVCPKTGKKCLIPCRGWDCPPPLPMCIFCALRAELRAAECAFVSTGQFWRGKHSQAKQAQIFLCPKSLTCELLYPTMTFSASQTDRTGLALVQQWR